MKYKFNKFLILCIILLSSAIIYQDQKNRALSEQIESMNGTIGQLSMNVSRMYFLKIDKKNVLCVRPDSVIIAQLEVKVKELQTKLDKYIKGELRAEFKEELDAHGRSIEKLRESIEQKKWESEQVRSA